MDDITERKVSGQTLLKPTKDRRLLRAIFAHALKKHGTNISDIWQFQILQSFIKNHKFRKLN